MDDPWFGSRITSLLVYSHKVSLPPKLKNKPGWLSPEELLKPGICCHNKYSPTNTLILVLGLDMLSLQSSFISGASLPFPGTEPLSDSATEVPPSDHHSNSWFTPTLPRLWHSFSNVHSYRQPFSFQNLAATIESFMLAKHKSLISPFLPSLTPLLQAYRVKEISSPPGFQLFVPPIPLKAPASYTFPSQTEPSCLENCQGRTQNLCKDLDSLTCRGDQKRKKGIFFPSEYIAGKKKEMS